MATITSKIIMKITEQRFTALYKILGARDNLKIGRTIEKTFQEIVIAYSASGRHYHNLNHISDGLDEFDKVRHLIEDPDVWEAGWISHDKIYIPKSADNESESAADADKIYRELNIPPLTRVRILQRIMATTHDFLPKGNDDRFMVDIDLVSLGVSWKIF